jgi:hypothetical protein
MHSAINVGNMFSISREAARIGVARQRFGRIGIRICKECWYRTGVMRCRATSTGWYAKHQALQRNRDDDKGVERALNLYQGAVDMIDRNCVYGETEWNWQLALNSKNSCFFMNGRGTNQLCMDQRYKSSL